MILLSVKGKILNALPYLSKSKQKVATYILKNPAAVTKQSVAQLAAAAKSSPATVIRLLKDLEIASFTLLKINLAAEQNTVGDKDEKIYADIAATEDFDSIKQKLLANAQRSLLETTDQIDQRAISKLTQAIGQASQIILFGVGASALVAENIAQKWSRLGYVTIVETDLNSLLPKLINTAADSLIWLVSNSGETPEILVAAQHARSCKLTIASLTRFGKNSLTNYADIIIQTAQPPESSRRIAATSSLLAQFMAVDLIFYYFVSQHFDCSVKALQDSKRILQDYQLTFK